MKVFLSWSGELEQAIARELEAFFQIALQYVEVARSYDIAKGERWSEELASALDDSDFGVIIMTGERLDSPWKLFEAGALSKYKSRVSPVLFGDIGPTDVTGPLATFQLTVFGEEELRSLVQSINTAASEDLRIEDSKLLNSFAAAWSLLESKVQSLLNTHQGAVTAPERPDRDLIEESLRLLRDLHRSSRPLGGQPKKSANTETQHQWILQVQATVLPPENASADAGATRVAGRGDHLIDDLWDRISDIVPDAQPHFAGYTDDNVVVEVQLPFPPDTALRSKLHRELTEVAWIEHVDLA